MVWLAQFVWSLLWNLKVSGLISSSAENLNICVTFFSAKAYSVFHPFEVGIWVQVSAASACTTGVKDSFPLKTSEKRRIKGSLAS